MKFSMESFKWAAIKVVFVILAVGGGFAVVANLEISQPVEASVQLDILPDSHLS